MVKVGSSYPIAIRLAGAAALSLTFFFVSAWVFRSDVVAITLTGVFTTFLILVVAADARGLRFVHNVVKRDNIPYPAQDVTRVEAKTITSRWSLGASVTTVDFFFSSDNKRPIRLTDTRNPIDFVKSGYSDEQVEAILEWMSYIPETVEGYSHVEHLREMLAAKKLDQ